MGVVIVSKKILAAILAVMFYAFIAFGIAGVVYHFNDFIELMEK